MKQRLISGSIAAIFFIAMLLMSGNGFYVLLLLMALIGFAEFARLFQISRKQWIVWIGALFVGIMVVPWTAFIESSIPQLAFIWIFLFLLLFATVASKNRIHIGHSALLFIGALYIGIGFQSMVQIHWNYGPVWALMIFASIWMTDIGAYLFGRLFGKHLLWPAISPKKTIEGAFGGILFSLSTMVAFHLIGGFLHNIGEALMVGLVVGVFAQLGDLIQSAYKRHAGVKDSGTLIPGHGGILDRCDSWIIVFPIIHYIGVYLW